MSLFLRVTRYKPGYQSKAIRRTSEIMLSFDNVCRESHFSCLDTTYYSDGNSKLTMVTYSKGFIMRPPWPSDVFTRKLVFHKTDQGE